MYESKSVSEAARTLASRRWQDPKARLRAGEAMRAGRLVAAARELDSDGSLGLEQRAREIAAGRAAQS